MNNSYSALMVDMRHSRCLSDSRRQSAQEDLANAMDCTNEYGSEPRKEDRG